ncbi:hypothetical protein [Daejeonella sp.]|jgi:hypothetical protein|uniref:hypothetical protein n=1 Tax=Daejeonella sp. TaxID=2805397 RepID=UPI0037844A05
MMMNKREIFKRVAGIISELNEQFEYLSRNPDHLNDLELELFAANADFLSDHISILLKLNAESSQEVSNAVVLEPEIETDTIVIQELIEEPEELEAYEEETVEVNIPDWKFDIKNEELDSFEFEDKSADELFDRPLTEEEMRVIDEKTKLKTIFEEDPIEETVSDSLPEIEEPLEEIKQIIREPQAVKPMEEPQALTLNEMLSSQISQNTVSEQFNQRPIKDLKGLISLNDKLQFVRDLFNGYSLAYSEAIELINRFDSFDAADNFLKQNYAIKNSWSDKQDVADKFYEILNRRFSN